MYFNLKCLENLDFSNLTTLILTGWANRPLQDITGISNLSSSLTSLSISCTSSDFTGWSEIAELDKLSNLTIENSNLNTLEYFSKLHSLTELTVSNSKISSCIPLIGNTSLTYIDLQNNILYPDSSTTDSEGNPVTYYNCQILANLNPSAGNGGQLTTLYLSGNEYLTTTDYAYVQAYTWSASDF